MLMYWQNRILEIMRMFLMLHMTLMGELPEMDKVEELPKVPDLVDNLFALMVNLLRQVEQSRKGLVDKRLRAADNDTEAQLITSEDLKWLEKIEKLKRAFHAEKGLGKGRSKGFGHRRSFKGGKPWSMGKGFKAGRGSPKPFSFLQVMPPGGQKPSAG